ncbi:NmrA family transcriptional regulator [Agarivorans sp. B2Z047]|uniref:NAD(P)H-binding protein n=1 Tax=Agarivorans sp. B2Z047 TaxID=2652721 RepID=UPI00128DDF27|nr:NAD(P)H-binding protein [Agarivorans sp. B2Z047]MPW29087.1 NmrA family transcriptional regulator [Agarivorans sp. B2Z047]UQN41640.1 NAD(P)H-binding protein [Agarivorans sp. B2Z047]
MTATTLIIGAKGKTGRRVESLLQAKGIRTRGVSRSSSPAFDWLKPDTWLEAIQGCESAYVTYQPDLAVPAAKQHIAEFIVQAKKAGIKHLVLLSGRGEQGAEQAEQQLINSGLKWNVVRASWFSQNFSEGFLIESVLAGQVALPAADVLEPFVDVDDIAEVAVACLTKPALANTLFEVTGPELLTLRDCVTQVAQAQNKPIEFIEISVSQFVEALKNQGMPAEMLWLMRELFGSVMDGRNSHLCKGVEQALGRKPKSFSSYAAEAHASGAWQR